MTDKNKSKREKERIDEKVEIKAEIKAEAQKGARYEDNLKEIDTEIAKKRGKWNLTSLGWMDYDDVAQILRFHIFRKWHLYNPEKYLRPWVRAIISNQIKNLIRNNYTNFVKPCNRCEAAIGENGCEIYKTQCNSCPLYKNWEKNKKEGLYARMPLSLENYSQEVYYVQNNPSFDIERSSENLHKKMQEILKPHEWKVYDLLYIQHKDEEEVAQIMGYKTTEKNRRPGYKHIKNITKKIIQKAKDCIKNDEIDIF